MDQFTYEVECVSEGVANLVAHLVEVKFHNSAQIEGSKVTLPYAGPSPRDFNNYVTDLLLNHYYAAPAAITRANLRFWKQVRDARS